MPTPLTEAIDRFEEAMRPHEDAIRTPPWVRAVIWLMDIFRVGRE